MKKILEEFESLDISILNLMKKGLGFCFKLCIFSTFILLMYKILHIPNLFYIGFSLLKASLFFTVSFICYGFIFNKMKNSLTNFK